MNVYRRGSTSCLEFGNGLEAGIPHFDTDLVNMPRHSQSGIDKPFGGARQRADLLDLVDAGFRYAFSLTHHRQDAEDLVQQACLRVVRKQGGVAEKGYLFVTIRNLFHDRLRRGSLISFAVLNDQAAIGSDSADIRHTDNRLDLEAILATLPCEERELIYLNCIEGFTAQEISEITGDPRGTILGRLARIKEKLTHRFSSKACEVET